jgi:serine protease Do
MVIAVGNPLGLNSTVTGGIVSAIGRGGLALGSDRSGYSVENFIQTDAAINPGNSGGGLFNLEGSLVGINTAIATRTGTYIGYGFAIPIDLVKAVILDLIDDGKVNRGYIGVRIKTVDEVEAKSSGLDKVEGAMVHEVMKGQAADKAGLEMGDIILEIDGKPVKTSNELQSQIVLHRAGDVVKLTVWRDGKKINKSVKLLARDEDKEDEKTVAGEEPKKDEDSNKPITFDKLGFSIAPLTSEIKKNNDVSKGVLVTKVERYGKAAERGLAPNGVIVKADRKDISSPEQLKNIIDSKKPGDAILLQLKYPDASRIVALQIPE